MTIKEVEKLLEVPRATVRFYEKEGLITPTRAGNGYRDYSEADVEKLKKIIIFRKIGVSVEAINDLFDGVKSMDVIICLGFWGIITCLLDHTWTVQSFVHGFWSMMSIIGLEMLLVIPLYFLGRKFKWVRENRNKALNILLLFLLVILLVILNLI